MYLFLSILIVIFIGILILVSNSIIKENEKYYSIDKYKQKVLLKLIEKEIDEMDGFKFEEFCCKLFNMNNFKAKTTPKTGDGGRDIIIKDYKGTIYVECKHYNIHNKIGTNLIHKLISSCVVDNIERGIFITTSTYTKESVKLVEKCKVVKIDLWYKEDLLELCKNINMYDMLMWLGYSKNYIDYYLNNAII